VKRRDRSELATQPVACSGTDGKQLEDNNMVSHLCESDKPPVAVGLSDRPDADSLLPSAAEVRARKARALESRRIMGVIRPDVVELFRELLTTEGADMIEALLDIRLGSSREVPG
jgi:hypothetical protein